MIERILYEASVDLRTIRGRALSAAVEAYDRAMTLSEAAVAAHLRLADHLERDEGVDTPSVIDARAAYDAAAEQRRASYRVYIAAATYAARLDRGLI